MSTRRITPPWDFFRDASQPSLESYELSRLNNAANLRREITALLDQWVEDNSQALLARWVHDRRNRRSFESSFAEEMPQPELPADNSAPSTAPASNPDQVIRISKPAALPGPPSD